MSLRLAALWLLGALTIASASADMEIKGNASVIDGDTIEIHGERIRLLDIDAPESKQTCTRPSGEVWRCGQQAALALSNWIGQRTTTCVTAELDRYGRHLSRCLVANQDVATWLTEMGWVVPYRDCKCEVIRTAAGIAKSQKVGIWSGDFVLPWVWRKSAASAQTILSQPSDNGGCLIKGNINSKGERIYHVPGSRSYNATRINTSKGERWFCSESEAQAAGWRPPAN